MIENEKLELIEILGRKALFDNGRIRPYEVPDGFYCYYLRSGDDTCFASIEPRVYVNMSGSVLMREPLDFGGEGYIPLDEDTAPNFLGEQMTPTEFLALDEQEQQGKLTL